jgi:hypothetical protein
VQRRRWYDLGDSIFEEHADPASRGGPERDAGINPGASDSDCSPPPVGPGGARILDVGEGRLHPESPEGGNELSFSGEGDSVLLGSGPEWAPDPEEPLVEVVRKESVGHEAASYSSAIPGDTTPSVRKCFPGRAGLVLASPGSCQKSGLDARFLA